MKLKCLRNIHGLILLASLSARALAVDVHAAHGFLTPSAILGGLEKKVSSVLHVQSSIFHVADGTFNNTLAVTYNVETPFVFLGQELGISIEGILASVFVCMIASVPLAIAHLEAKPTKTHMVQSLSLLVWLVSCLYLFTRVVKFRSVHFRGERPLTLVETIYLMAQVLTTVGHGDITPATPNGQAVVALYVLFTIIIISDMVSAVVSLAIARTRDYTKKLTELSLDRQAKVATHSQKLITDLATDVDLLRRGKAPLPWEKLCWTWSIFLSLVAIGVLFYHFFPGENKSWLEGIYMSVITLTTVGFGSVLPATEAGKVFGAFWMLFGVVSLLSVVSGCTELILAVKARERWSQDDERIELDGLRDRAAKAACGGKMLVNREEFLRFALLQSRMTEKDELEKIDRTFQAFCPDDEGNVAFEKIERATLFGLYDAFLLRSM